MSLDGGLYGRTLAAGGLFISVFAIVALTGPGRIDIVDGQTRYEVARSLVDHGDDVIRDEHVWFGRFPGRGGLDYTTYRFPQSVLGIPFIVLSDLTGSRNEARRHFFFSLTGAAAAATLAIIYWGWFVRRGLGVPAALGWAAAGIFCLPSWFYATSTFDDILGSLAVVAALVCAGPSTARALGAGLLVGLAFNCKQPLGVFALPVLAAISEPGPRQRQWAHWVFALSGVAAGVVVYVAYDAYKFPPGLEAARALLQRRYISPWPGKPFASMAVLALSPAAGVLWYCPPVILAAAGVRYAPAWHRKALMTAVGAFVMFISSMTIFKGDPAWGPRYLTPLFAAVWLYAPEGSTRFPKRVSLALLAAGVLVQVLALSVDPHRLYVERSLPSAFGAIAPVLYFDPRNAHLPNRPREIVEIWEARHDYPPEFSPAPSPTFAFPVLDFVPGGQATIRRFKILNTFRPWWASQIYLPRRARPVSLAGAAAVQLGLLGLGGIMLFRAQSSSARRRASG